ncbi:MAG: DegV family protein, partial [Lachnospiraceae bacterium]|nr:DegV family protein [Candidatus Equihabitans merdae]
AFAADSLGLKPMLKFTDGEVRDFAIARSRDEGLKKLGDLIYKEADPDYPITVFHGGEKELGESFKNRLQTILPDHKFELRQVGPVIGVYAGPGSIGYAFTTKENLK